VSAKTAFYSVIQFRPNELREEGVNVGLVVGIDNDPQLEVRLSKTNERLKRMFGAKAIDDVRVSSAKQALRSRLLATGPVSEQGLRDFLCKEAGQLAILPPRPMVVVDRSADLDALFREVVG
jgi:hypothetical protein